MARILLALVPFLLPTAALAHFGHVGEVAGHSHWVAVGAVMAAAAIAALAAKMNKGDKARDETPEEDVSDQPEAEERPA